MAQQSYPWDRSGSRRLLVAAALAIGFFGLVSLTGCSDPKAKARGEFLAGCVQGGATKALCTCTYERLELRFTQEELLQLTQPSLNAPPQRLMREAMQAALACRNA